MRRWLKYKYVQLIRVKGGESMIAMGLSIGFAVEMFTLPTAGLAFFLIFPLVYFLRASFAGALIGFAIGKIVYIPFAFLNSIVGGWLVSGDFRIRFGEMIYFLPAWMEKMLIFNLQLIIGGVIVGTVSGILLYFPVKFMLQLYTHRRKEKRKARKIINMKQ